MDIYCPRCGEPWEIDGLHDLSRTQGCTYTVARQLFAEFGCAAMQVGYDGIRVPNDGITPVCESKRSTLTAAAQVVYELSGDDMDGAAADLEDFMAMGLLDD